ncbi:m-AAA protease-interacting protein 1, mitochondrial isoform X2 [Callorhinchus milii]|uniref:m-AAA protease-interacting protein 1, mitochondrial isoform X2 n=1 Tax=Callorhinchus milii TaxID=7868 RepID=UPI001C3F9C67|nr:m-AAA protease-interacting protein 1, mitochondrial isoform X2 [Callorhinchus milii]
MALPTRSCQLGFFTVSAAHRTRLTASAVGRALRPCPQALSPRPRPTWLPALTPRSRGRAYSTERSPHQRGPKKVVVVGIPNPFIWARTKMYFFLIRSYFDHEFNFDEFADGAKQALEELEGKCSALPIERRKALAADMEEIMYSTPGDVGIYYDNQGRKFVHILMRYWYLSNVDLPSETPEGTKMFQVVFGDENSKDSKCLLTANYEFRREFTQGVEPNWTITRIQHFKLLE